MPIWKVFWGYGVCASVVIIGLYAVAAVEHRLALQQTVLIFFALYTAWLPVAIWRCAERSAPQLNLIVRLLTVAWTANTVMVVLFLQLDLITAALQS